MVRTITLIAAVISLTACANSMCEKPVEPAKPTTPTENSAPTLTTCPEKRPEVCTFDYRPVCATRDTGIRCITAPCPSTEQKTYGNACSACADEKVIGHIPGECVPPNKTPTPNK